ncbi:MAG: leucine-rich repeat domain-containing protein [Prevotella sp.]|nr:leucine-rich repeat domain-containing protein [Prevotella sp.]
MDKKQLLLIVILMFCIAVGAQTEGSHFRIKLNQSGTLKTKLTSAVFETDYDLVDSLTISGKMGGADFAYLNDQEGLVSQLSYLDLTDVELVYDDEPYHSFQRGSALEGSIKIYTFFLSAENREDGGGGGINDMNTSRFYEYRNNLAAAFRGMANLKTCILPKSLNGLGEYAFANCKSIEKVVLPDGLTYIGEEAFLGESGFGPDNNTLKNVNIPATVDSIGIRAFAYQPINNLDVSHVSHFGSYCFQQTFIKSFQLGDKVKNIPDGMCYNCTKLTSVSIPSSVESIGKETFAYCEELKTVTLNEGVKKIGQEAFSGCRQLSDMTMASTIEEIGKEAFGAVPYVDNIAAEGGVKYIGKVAYILVKGTTSVNIKEGTVSIAESFAGGGQYLGSHEWWGQSDLTSITLPSTLRNLGPGCFVASKISSITLPDNLEVIGNGAFYDCEKLRRITIPEGIKYIGAQSFGGRCGVVRVYYNAIDAKPWSEYHPASYQGDAYTEYAPVFGAALTRVIIAEGVKTIPTYMFRKCKNITRVQMPSTVETIGMSAFEECTSLEHIDLPSSLKSMEGNALFCGNLLSVTSYLKEPFVLEFPRLSEEYARENANAYYGKGHGRVEMSYVQAMPFGGQAQIIYVIDEQENVTVEDIIYSAPWTQKIPLLQVPNGSLAAYQNETTWAVNFQQIAQFDGVSDASTVEETMSVNVSNSVTEETDLTGSLIGSIYVTLDTEDSGDGYNATEGCIVINSQTTEEGVAAATADNADDLTVKNLLNGLVFELPAGRGKITVDCQTLGSRVLFVKIGGNEPQKVSLSARGTMTLDYEVKENTRVFIYAANDTQASRRAAYANDDAVKIYGLTINVDENVNGIKTPVSGTGKEGVRKVHENARIYILLPDGRRYNTTGTRIYNE